jgi:hypothetical protein
VSPCGLSSERCCARLHAGRVPGRGRTGALKAGKQVELAGVRVELDGDGLRAVLEDGAEAVSHQAFWFAWSQFHPRTALWTPMLQRKT